MLPDHGPRLGFNARCAITPALPPIVATPRATNERPDLCGPCGGQCCKRMPGETDPADLGAPNARVLGKQIRALLRSGGWAVDWWDATPNRPYLRPATVESGGAILDPSWGGQCALLTDAGCQLAFSDRPRGCRSLEPHASGFGHCHGKWGKRQSADAWFPYRRLLWDCARTVERERRAPTPRK